MPTPNPDPDDEHVHGTDCDHEHAPQEPFRRSAPKHGRNDPCHCGSGRKFKKCHGAQAS